MAFFTVEIFDQFWQPQIICYHVAICHRAVEKSGSTNDAESNVSLLAFVANQVGYFLVPHAIPAKI